MSHKPRRYAGSARLGYWARLLVRSWVLPSLVLGFAAYVALAIVSPPLQGPLEYVGFSVPAVPRFEVSGFVRDPKGSPAAGAVVQVGGYKTHTDGVGYYMLRFPSKVTTGIPLVVLSAANQSKLVYFDSDSSYRSVVDVVIS